MGVSESRIEAGMKHCIHFNGLVHKECRAGVVYESIRGDEGKGLERWPCFAESPCRTCDRRHIRSREEVVAECEANDAKEAARPVDSVLGVKYDVDENGDKFADVVQRGYRRCRHSGLYPSVAALKEQGFKGYRIVMFTDGDRCPECLAKRGSA